MRSNLPLLLSSSVVEQSAVNRPVLSSNPTWGDLIHSKLKNRHLTECHVVNYIKLTMTVPIRT